MSTELELMAKEADFEVLSNGEVMSLGRDEVITLRLSRFASLVAERCAQIAEAHQWWDESGQHSSPEDQHKAVAEKIRAAFKERP